MHEFSVLLSVEGGSAQNFSSVNLSSVRHGAGPDACIVLKIALDKQRSFGEDGPFWQWFVCVASMKQISIPILAGLAQFFSGATVRWVGCAPDDCQRVYFANHTSHLDALVLWASLPRHLRALTRPVAAKDYWCGGPVRRYVSSLFNVILIDRKAVKVHNSPIDMMIREIGMRQSLIVFPEGSRNLTGEMKEFKSGLYYLGKKRPDLELMPVYIDNLNRVMPKGEFLPVPLLSCITIGPPIWLEQGENKTDFLYRARQAVTRLKEL